MLWGRYSEKQEVIMMVHTNFVAARWGCRTTPRRRWLRLISMLNIKSCAGFVKMCVEMDLHERLYSCVRVKTSVKDHPFLESESLIEHQCTFWYEWLETSASRLSGSQKGFIKLQSAKLQGMRFDRHPWAGLGAERLPQDERHARTATNDSTI